MNGKRMNSQMSKRKTNLNCPLNEKTTESAINISNMKRLRAFPAVFSQVIARRSLGLSMRRASIILGRAGFQI